MTQSQQILNWFKENRYINRQNAMALNPPIWNLTAVISEMRARGIIIDSVPMKEGKRYVKYELIRSENDGKQNN